MSQKSPKKGWNDSAADYIGRLVGVVMSVRGQGSGWPEYLLRETLAPWAYLGIIRSPVFAGR
ncbi:hypothetical protein AERO8C_30178 [Aeromonas veronii]|uniref:Uncharacterized protein n=1 Tax=Aeromonas veronii TaxID=654 RepID=A0A653L6U2_AERVE|nr:hypothetical protein AERO8C_30178 [Aeromonas veronii]